MEMLVSSEFKITKNGMPENLLEDAWMVHAIKILTNISQKLNTAKTLERTNIGDVSRFENQINKAITS